MKNKINRKPLQSLSHIKYLLSSLLQLFYIIFNMNFIKYKIGNQENLDFTKT